MRLCDLDALYEEVADHVTSVSVCATAQQAIGQTDFKWRCLEDIHNAPTIDAIPVEWMRDKMRGYASALKSTETAALVMVMQMWQKEQGART